MTVPKLTRPVKGHYVCYICKTSCSPRNGDWQNVPDSQNGNQVFVCQKCETKFKRTIEAK